MRVFNSCPFQQERSRSERVRSKPASGETSASFTPLLNAEAQGSSPSQGHMTRCHPKGTPASSLAPMGLRRFPAQEERETKWTTLSDCLGFGERKHLCPTEGNSDFKAFSPQPPGPNSQDPTEPQTTPSSVLRPWGVDSRAMAPVLPPPAWKQVTYTMRFCQPPPELPPDLGAGAA